MRFARALHRRRRPPNPLSNPPLTPFPALPKTTAKEANEEALERCKAVMEEHRKRLAAAPAPAVADPWQREAARRWGARVLQVQGVSDWAAYVRSRTARPPPNLPSPYALLQERYSFDPWHLLVACILMSRVSSAEVKDRCLGGFFQACPTPSALLDTDPATLLPILRSLGLFPNRMAGVLDVTQRFIDLPEFDVGLQGDLKIKGVGEFGYHSYLIFCRDENPHPSDKNLASFVSWRNATRAGAPSQLLAPGALLTPPAPNPPPEAVAAAAAAKAAAESGAAGEEKISAAGEEEAAAGDDAGAASASAASPPPATPTRRSRATAAVGRRSAVSPRRRSPRKVPVAEDDGGDGQASAAEPEPSAAEPSAAEPSAAEPSAASPRRRSPRKAVKGGSSDKSASAAVAARAKGSDKAKGPASKTTKGRSNAARSNAKAEDAAKVAGGGAAGQRRTIADYFAPSR